MNFRDLTHKQVLAAQKNCDEQFQRWSTYSFRHRDPTPEQIWRTAYSEGLRYILTKLDSFPDGSTK